MNDKPALKANPWEVGTSDVEDVEFVPHPRRFFVVAFVSVANLPKREVTSGFVFLRSHWKGTTNSSGVTVGGDERRPSRVRLRQRVET